jgi:hypothetical protein
MRSTVSNQRGELVMDGVQRYLLKRRAADPIQTPEIRI